MKIRFKIKRQDKPGSEPYWQNFEISSCPQMTVIGALREIQKNSINSEGKAVVPVVWESSCLKELCGACSMIVNGKAIQACGVLIDSLAQPIRLEPLSKFPVLRDLCVDRSRLFDSLKRAQAWVSVDGTQDLGLAPRVSQSEQSQTYDLSTCVSCGLCLEVCPQYHDQSEFIGAHALNQVQRHDLHPISRQQTSERLNILLQPGGFEDCGHSQNCVKVCPAGIPLTTSIAQVGRKLTKHVFRRGLGVRGWGLGVGGESDF